LTSPPHEPGSIEQAVLADLKTLGELKRVGQPTLAALATKLARVLDARDDDEPASQTAKAVDTLRITMGKLTEADTHDPGIQKQIAALLSSPDYGGSEVSAQMGYPQKPGPANAGRGGGPDRESPR
jgi:hypothetical protein